MEEMKKRRERRRTITVRESEYRYLKDRLGMSNKEYAKKFRERYPDAPKWAPLPQNMGSFLTCAVYVLERLREGKISPTCDPICVNCQKDIAPKCKAAA